jgi:hypothetical protein
MSEDYLDFDDDFDDFLRQYMQRELDILNGTFRVVLPDSIIFGLDYVTAQTVANELITVLGYSDEQRDYECDDWLMEYYVDDGDGWLLFASIESEIA